MEAGKSGFPPTSRQMPETTKNELPGLAPTIPNLTTMSWKIEIHKAKPNPAGKDKAGNYPIASQLLGEWVDLKNTGDAAVDLSTLNLTNREFGEKCNVTTEAKIYWTGPSGVVLTPGQIVRVHTGRLRDAASTNAVDQVGANVHVYAESGTFVLNNKCGDSLGVWWQTAAAKKWHLEDAASYGANPGEGKVLQRVGKSLV